MKKHPRVALLIESSHGYGRQLLLGIAAYANVHGPWTLHQEERAFDDPMPRGLKEWLPDGVIARVGTPQLARQLRRLCVPVIDLYEQGLFPGCNRVLADHQAAVRLAVDHLRERGFQHFAFAGFSDAIFSRERARAFARCVTAWGFTPHLYSPPSSRKPRGLAAIEASAMHHAGALAVWLRGLPKPAGLVTCNDMYARQVMTVCNENGIAVPDALGVIGIDNDEMLCNLSSPSLSSVDPNAYRIGHEAAALLHGMIRRRRRAMQTIVVGPAGIVPRHSTDVLAFADPEIVELVRYVREHACEGLKVKNVVRYANSSPVTVFRQFLKHLGRTPRDEIARVQVERARELLATSNIPLKQVARLAGYSHVETMYRALRKALNQTPTEYRRATGKANSPLSH